MYRNKHLDKQKMSLLFPSNRYNRVLFYAGFNATLELVFMQISLKWIYRNKKTLAMRTHLSQVFTT